MTTSINDITFNALNPVVTQTDILFGETFTEGAVLPSSYFLPYQYISYQWSTPDCTAHGQAGASNENNGLEASKLNAMPEAKLIDPVQLGEFGHSIGKITSQGGYINWAFGFLKNWGYITWYTVVAHDESEMKKAIMRTWALVTGSNSIPWGDFEEGWYAKYKPSSSGHCFRIDGWDDSRQAFRVANSWWETWGDKGSFWVRYADIDKLLYTCYAFHDKDDTAPILQAKAKKLWIWDWTRGDAVATRAETVILAYRIMGRPWSDYDMLAEAKLKKVYNGERDNDKVTLFEAKLMFSRIWVAKSPIWVTRGELVQSIN